MVMKKLFIFSDAHAFYDQLMKALAEAGFDQDNRDHILVSCGDLCDRGLKAVETLNFINQFDDERKICIIGNHELIMEDLIARGYPAGYDGYNGTVSTLRQLTDIYGDDERAAAEMKYSYYWNRYRRNWIWCLELEDYILVHGWIPVLPERMNDYRYYRSYDPKWRKTDERSWRKAVWINGMDAWSMGIREKGKTIICGHWHTSWGHAFLHDEGLEFPDEKDPGSYALFTPFVDEGIIALDGCTAYSGLVNVWTMELEDEAWEKAVKDSKKYCFPG